MLHAMLVNVLLMMVLPIVHNVMLGLPHMQVPLLVESVNQASMN